MSATEVSSQTTPQLAALSECQHQTAIDGLRASLNTALIGKDDIVEMVLACLLARGHLLFDDLPGLGKTTLAKAVAHAVPHGHDDRIGLRRVHDHIDDARVIVDVQYVLPRFTSIASLEDSSFAIRAIQPAQHPDVDDVRIFGMN